MKNTSRLTIVLIALCLSGCGGASTSLPNALKSIPNPLSGLKSQESEPEAISGPVILENEAPATELGAGGLSPDSLDTTTQSELTAATNISGGNNLGETVASLGDPTQTGLWLRTPLVSAETAGRLEAANGKSLAVTLIPIEGTPSSGSRISLAAMRGLGLGLTDLPNLKVFRVTASG